MLQRLLNIFKGPSQKRSTLTLSDPGGWPHIRDNQPTRVTEVTALTISAVYACAKHISESIASLTLHVYMPKKDGRDRDLATSHPQYYLLKKEPNPYYTSYKFIQTIIFNYLMWGNGYARIYRNERTAAPERYELRHPLLVRPFIQDDALFYAVDGDIIPYTDMIHISDISSDGVIGKSRIRLAAESIGAAKAGDEFINAFYTNGVFMGGVIEFPEGVSFKENTNTIQNLRTSFKDTYGGVEKAGQVGVIERGGKFKQLELAMPLSEAQFLESRKFSVEEICRIFNVPPHLVQHNEKSTYNNIEHQAIEYVQYTLRSIIRMIEMELDRKCFRMSDPAYVKFEINSLLRGDIKSRYEAYTMAITHAIMKPSEVRQLEDLPYDPVTDIFLVPLNHIPADKLDEYYTQKENKSLTPKTLNGDGRQHSNGVHTGIT